MHLIIRRLNEYGEAIIPQYKAVPENNAIGLGHHLN